MKIFRLLLSLTFLIICLILNINKLQAQDIDHQFWMNYSLNIPINKQLSWGGDMGIRGLGSNRDWNQILIRPAISYRPKNIYSIALAVAYFGTYNQDNYNLTEFRIHQDFNLKWPDFGFIEFFYRIRVEERFFFYEEDYPNSFKVRLRGLIGLETEDITWFGTKRPIYFQILFEGFRTLDNEEAIEVFINQTRLHFAFGHRIAGNFRYELHYIKQRSRLLSESGRITGQNLYRIRLFHRLPGK